MAQARPITTAGYILCTHMLDMERGRPSEAKAISQRQGSASSDFGMLHRPSIKWFRLSFRHWTLLFIGSLLTFVLLSGRSSNVAYRSSRETGEVEVSDTKGGAISTPRYSSAVLGPPTQKFRDNLHPDSRYLTSWLSAGFTNDVMTIANMIYLARITDRIPIIPAMDSFIGKRPSNIQFSAIFDVPYLEAALNMPIIEWHQVKDVNSSDTDSIGCWSIYEVDDASFGAPRYSRNSMHLVLDISYTRAPASVKLLPAVPHDYHSSFWALAPLAFPDTREKALSAPGVETHRSDRLGKIILPDEQVLCYDYLFYVCADVPHEYDQPIYPAWNAVQRHFRWTTEVQRVGNLYLRRLLGVPSRAPIPPHITVHVRHGDFKDWCREYDPLACFAPLSVYAVRVAEVQKELMDRKGIDVKHVILTSDEQDEGWWNQVKELGWLRIDHAKERTAEVHGEWYPVIVDALVQGAGLGFVGTERSTFSVLAKLRVRDWQDGAVRMVKWGTPDADSH